MDPKLMSTNPEAKGYSQYELTEIPKKELKKYEAEHDKYFKDIAAREEAKKAKNVRQGGRRLRRTRHRRRAKRTGRPTKRRRAK